MSTVTSILSTDALEPTSRTTINTNFQNLNVDKVESASPTFTGTVTLPVGLTGVVRVVAGVVTAFTTSSTLAAVITDETGSGALVFGTNPTIAKPVMDATNPSAQTYTPAGGATATLDLSLANEHRITMPAGNATIALSSDTNAQKFIVSILQDSVGSRTVIWFSTIRWAGGSTPVLTTTASKRDTFGFIRTGSGTYDGFIIGQNV